MNERTLATAWATFQTRLLELRLGLRLKLAYARVLGSNRGAYKKIWNMISHDYRSAMIGVAGTANETEFFSSGAVSADAMMIMLDIRPQHIVLEIGCGVGRIGKSLAPHCKKWIGADISSEMIRFARENLAGFDNAEFVELSSSSLIEIPTNYLDRIYSSAVFMHLDEWDRYRYVSEAFRVLKPGGRCYFDNINLAGEAGWRIFLEMSRYEPELRPPNISKASTAEELRTYLLRAGFDEMREFPGSHFVAVTGRKPAV